MSEIPDDIATLRRERNMFKGKNASLLALISKMRDRLAVITSDIEDEGDRAYFGSTNDADELKAFEVDLMDWLIDAQVPHLTMTEDPYAEIREQRARAEKAEAEKAVWRTMDTAPVDGTHCILAVKDGPFVYSIQGTYSVIEGQWNCAGRANVQPLYWMPNVLLPASPTLTPEHSHVE